MILTADKMERGRGQVLQRYRPDQTFDHENHFIARVTDYRVDHAYDRDLPLERLVEEGTRYVNRWRIDARNGPFRAPGADAAPTFPAIGAATAFYNVVVPGSLQFSYYPLSVTCGNPQCRRVYLLPRVPEPGQEIGKCPTCHADPSYQTQYLMVHGCGYAKPFEPPSKCDSGCENPGFRLDSQASRFRDFRWICMRCGSAREVSDICTNQTCKFISKVMSPEVHTSGQAYVPHSVVVVNPPSPADGAPTHTLEYRIGIVGEWLGVCSEADFEALASGRAKEMDPGLREAIELLRKAAPEQAAELERKHAPLDVEKLRSRIRERIGAAADDEIALATLASRLETYRRTLRRGAITLETLERVAASESRRVLYARYPTVLREAGLDPEKVALVPDFPVIELAVGYSRSGYTAKEADLRSFSASAGRGQAAKTVFYAHPQRTEALVVGLDAARTARWLDINRLAPNAETGGTEGVRNWFARYLSRRADELEWLEFEIQPPQEDVGGDALARLMHSMSHQFIRALSVDSGFMETSLSEHFFPYHLGFAVYPRATTEFVIGGLRTVMEQNLDDVVRRALDNDTCLYDPNCLFASRGADQGCLYLPETACSFRNRNSHLSRWDLFGSPDGSFLGYWDQRLDQ